MKTWLCLDNALDVLDAIYRLRARIAQARTHAEEWAELALLAEPLLVPGDARARAMLARRVERLDLYPGVQHLVMRSEESLLGAIRLNLHRPDEPWPLPCERPAGADKVMVASAWILTEQMLRARPLAQLLELVTLLACQKQAQQLLIELPLAVEMLAHKQGFLPCSSLKATPYYTWWSRPLHVLGAERMPSLSLGGIERVQVSAGTPLYGWSEEVDAAYVVARGSVELSLGAEAGHTPFALVEAGEAFGEEALLEHATRRWCHAMALTEVEVWRLQASRLRQHRPEDVGIRQQLEQSLVSRLHQLAQGGTPSGGLSKAALRRAELHQRREELKETQALWRLS